MSTTGQERFQNFCFRYKIGLYHSQVYADLSLLGKNLFMIRLYFHVLCMFWLCILASIETSIFTTEKRFWEGCILIVWFLLAGLAVFCPYYFSIAQEVEAAFDMEQAIAIEVNKRKVYRYVLFSSQKDGWISLFGSLFFACVC